MQALIASSTSWLHPALAMALPCAAALAMVLLLRFAKIPLRELGARAVVAGTVAGVLLGPSVFGRVLPRQFEAIFIGGVEQREDLEYARWFAGAAPAAATSLSEEGRAQFIAQQMDAIAGKEAALDAARREHRQRLTPLVAAAVGLMLLASATRLVRSGDRRQGWLTAASVGFWSFALPAAAAYLCAVRFWEASITQGALLAAAVSIGPWALGAIERSVADGAEFGGARMMQSAGRIASALAIALAMWAAWRASSFEGMLMMAALFALPLAWCADLLRRGDGRAKPQAAAGAIETVTRGLVVESLIALVTALVAMKIDLHVPWTWATVGSLIVLSLIADDGRWLGALIGAMLPGGRPGLRTMRLVMPAMAAGPTQLALAALALHGGLLAERFALPLLAGAILIEITAPARLRMAERLIETEEELDETN